VISGKIAKEVFEEMLKTKEHPKTIVERKGSFNSPTPARLKKLSTRSFPKILRSENNSGTVSAIVRLLCG